jgi:hypothetical protein
MILTNKFLVDGYQMHADKLEGRPEWLVDLIGAMCDQDADRRPSIEQVLAVLQHHIPNVCARRPLTVDGETMILPAGSISSLPSASVSSAPAVPPKPSPPPPFAGEAAPSGSPSAASPSSASPSTKKPKDLEWLPTEFFENQK